LFDYTWAGDHVAGNHVRPLTSTWHAPATKTAPCGFSSPPSTQDSHEIGG